MHDGARRTSRRKPDLECECVGGGNEGQGNLSCGEMRVGLVFEGISVIATREIRGTAESGLISFFDVTFVLVCARLDRRETSEMKKCTPKTRRARVAGREKGVWVRLASNRFKRAKGRGREVRGNFRHRVASRRRDAAQPNPLAQNTKMVVARRGRKKSGSSPLRHLYGATEANSHLPLDLVPG